MYEVIYGDPEYVKTLQREKDGGIFHISGYVIYVKNDDKTYYLACPEEACRRKVYENTGHSEQPGKYRCDHCNRCFDSAIPFYMMSCKIGDCSESLYVSFYRQAAEAILNGTTAEQLRRLKDNGDTVEVEEIFRKAAFRHLTFTLKA
jgi:hypothetical protein